MEFLLLAAIFLTSSGFLVGAAVAPSQPVAISPLRPPVSEKGETMTPQPLPIMSDWHAQPAGS
jgi:hypothetical protein